MSDIDDEMGRLAEDLFAVCAARRAEIEAKFGMATNGVITGALLVIAIEAARNIGLSESDVHEAVKVRFALAACPAYAKPPALRLVKTEGSSS